MELWSVFLTLGGLFFLGLVADLLGRHTVVPRVTLLMLGGVVIGGLGLGLVPEGADAWYDFLSVTALTMVAFLLGGSLAGPMLREHGRPIIMISLSIVIVSSVLVALGLMAIGVDPVAAILLGAIAAATDPAATQDVIRQSGRKDSFTDTLKGIVAIDDAWGLILFGVALTLAHATGGVAGSEAILFALWEIGGAISLGVVIGFPSAYASGRIRDGEPLRAEALAIVFLTAGFALWLDVSFLIAGMTAGAIVVNVATHHERSFHEIERIQWPFMLLFFVLAGASLEVDQLVLAGVVGSAFIGLRLVARFIASWLGARIAKVPAGRRHWYGPALLAQAGVAVGMALVAAREFPEHGELILTVTIASTVIFELVGPVATRYALDKAP